MNSTDLVERVRLNVFGTAANLTDYTDAVIMTELWNQQVKMFGRNIINARAGYWIAQDEFSGVAATGMMQINSRSHSSNIEKAELSSVSSPGEGDWYPIEEIEESQVQNYALSFGQTGVPYNYVQRNDNLVLQPFPNASIARGRITYYMRPSKLVAPQDGTGGSTQRGVLTALPSVTGSVTAPTAVSLTFLNLPFDMTLSTPAAPTGLQPIDIVRGGEGSWHEVIWRGFMTFSASPQAITIGGANNGSAWPLSLAAQRVRPGDYIRLINQSEWPALPDDYHDCLADCAAIKIMKQLNMSMKADDLAASLSADLNRFQDLITPRAKNSAKDIIGPAGLYRGSARGWTVKYP